MTGPDRRGTQKGGTQPTLILPPDIDPAFDSWGIFPSAFSGGFLPNAFNSDVTSATAFSSAFSNEFGNEIRMGDDLEDFHRTISSFRRAYSEVGEIKMNLHTAKRYPGDTVFDDRPPNVGYHMLGEVGVDFKARHMRGEYKLVGVLSNAWSTVEEDPIGHNSFNGGWFEDPDGTRVTSARTAYDGNELVVVPTDAEVPGPIYDFAVEPIHGRYAHFDTVGIPGITQQAKFDNFDPTAREAQAYIRIVDGTGAASFFTMIGAVNEMTVAVFDLADENPTVKLIATEGPTWHEQSTTYAIEKNVWYRMRLIWSIGGPVELHIYESDATDALSSLSVTPIISPITEFPSGVSVTADDESTIVFDVADLRWGSGPFGPVVGLGA